MYKTLWKIGSSRYWLVQDFFHQQYDWMSEESNLAKKKQGDSEWNTSNALSWRRSTGDPNFLRFRSGHGVTFPSKCGAPCVFLKEVIRVVPHENVGSSLKIQVLNWNLGRKLYRLYVCLDWYYTKDPFVCPKEGNFSEPILFWGWDVSTINPTWAREGVMGFLGPVISGVTTQLLISTWKIIPFSK